MINDLDYIIDYYANGRQVHLIGHSWGAMLASAFICEFPEKINKIAIETSTELLKKIIGAQVNNSSISAIVNDLSKKKGDKYYGN